MSEIDQTPTAASSAAGSAVSLSPGAALSEWLHDAGLPREDAAFRLNLTDAEFEALLVGAHPLTPDLASDLEELTEMPAVSWWNLESQYLNALQIRRATPAAEGVLRGAGPQRLRFAGGKCARLLREGDLVRAAELLDDPAAQGLMRVASAVVLGDDLVRVEVPGRFPIAVPGSRLLVISREV